MKTYNIEVQRVSYITMEIEAESQAEAESKAWEEVTARGDSNYADWQMTLCEEKTA